jgi:hypothetical protein
VEVGLWDLRGGRVTIFSGANDAQTKLRTEQAKNRLCGVHLRGGSLGWTWRVGLREMGQLISQRNRIFIYENAI